MNDKVAARVVYTKTERKIPAPLPDRGQNEKQTRTVIFWANDDTMTYVFEPQAVRFP